MENEYVGKSVPRVEGVEKVTGRAVYSVDVEIPGMLYGAVLRSPTPCPDLCPDRRDRHFGSQKCPGG